MIKFLLVFLGKFIGWWIKFFVRLSTMLLLSIFLNILYIVTYQKKPITKRKINRVRWFYRKEAWLWNNMPQFCIYLGFDTWFKRVNNLITR